jgi:hypothetical protein
MVIVLLPSGVLAGQRNVTNLHGAVDDADGVLREALAGRVDAEAVGDVEFPVMGAAGKDAASELAFDQRYVLVRADVRKSLEAGFGIDEEDGTAGDGEGVHVADPDVVLVAEVVVGDYRGGAVHFSSSRKKVRTSFFAKKEAKKLSSPAAFEGPNCGRSKAGVNKSFLVTFFQKSNFFLPFF